MMAVFITPQAISDRTMAQVFGSLPVTAEDQIISNPDQARWDFWWTKCRRDRFFS